MELSDKAKEVRLKYYRDWRAKHPGYDEAWRKNNKASVKVSQKRWRRKNKKYSREYLRDYLKRNPEKAREYERRKWERLAEQNTVTENKVTVTEKNSVTSELKTCLHCGRLYHAIRKTSKYCSDNCRVKYNRKQKYGGK